MEVDAGGMDQAAGSSKVRSSFGFVDAGRDRPHGHQFSRKRNEQIMWIGLFTEPAFVGALGKDQRHAVVDLRDPLV